ncbi:hypothetical protein RhiirB3_431369 [Rhizophagus irregularis]|nr:hypothetical protein RhiirB3_431369 [Rhizophagus irregularis]
MKEIYTQIIIDSGSSEPVELVLLHLNNLLEEFKPKLPVCYKKAITDYPREIVIIDNSSYYVVYINVQEFSDKVKAIMRVCAFDAGLIKENYSNLLHNYLDEAAAIYCMKSLEGQNLAQPENIRDTVPILEQQYCY